MTKLRIALTLALIIIASFSSAAQQQQSSASTQEAEAAARTRSVQTGEMAPDFTLEDHEGRKVRLSGARGQSPTVLVFYRGYW